MKLEFQLLVVDDNPGSVYNSVGILEDYLKDNSFSLKCHYAKDLSQSGLRDLARKSGREFDLVAIDFNLSQDTNGAVAAKQLRADLRFTDMVFYSSDSNVSLLQELANCDVAGVFVSLRDNLDESLKGLAETVIGKAIDLNHMRGIAMAEVAEMDVMMEEVLDKVFSSPNDDLINRGRDTLKKLLTSAEENLQSLRTIVEDGRILDVVTDSGLFSSMQRYRAIRRACKALQVSPAVALTTFNDYEPDIIQNRNTLAHAKEDVAQDGTISLRAIKRGKPPITIDDQWMASFRSMLRTQKAALTVICDSLSAHVDSVAPKQ